MLNLHSVQTYLLIGAGLAFLSFWLWRPDQSKTEPAETPNEEEDEDLIGDEWKEGSIEEMEQEVMVDWVDLLVDPGRSNRSKETKRPDLKTLQALLLQNGIASRIAPSHESIVGLNALQVGAHDEERARQLLLGSIEPNT